MEIENFTILGIPISNLNLNECVDFILQEVKQENLSSKYICTLNTDFVANMYGWGFQSISDPKLLKVIRSSTLVTPDGMPIVWLSRILGNSLKERVTGADLIPLLAQRLGEHNLSIFLLGGENDVTQQAAKILSNLNPYLKIVGAETPTITLGDDHEWLVKKINHAAPDVLLINLGNPKQELWFKSIQEHLQVPISIGIGGTLNFITGKTKRAPIWMQNFGLEWLYRLIQEPKRLFRRYFFDILKFSWFSIPLITFHTLNRLFTFSGDISVENNSYDSDSATLNLPKHLCSANLAVVIKNLEDAGNHKKLILDFSKTAHIDLEGISFLIKTVRNRKNVHIQGVKWNVRTLLILHKAWNLLKEYE